MRSFLKFLANLPVLRVCKIVSKELHLQVVDGGNAVIAMEVYSDGTFLPLGKFFGPFSPLCGYSRVKVTKLC